MCWHDTHIYVVLVVIVFFLCLLSSLRTSWHILMRMKAKQACEPIAPLELPHSLHAFHQVSSTDDLNLVRRVFLSLSLRLLFLHLVSIILYLASSCDSLFNCGSLYCYMSVVSLAYLCQIVLLHSNLLLQSGNTSSFLKLCSVIQNNKEARALSSTV